MLLHRGGYPAASDTDFSREVAYCKKELLTRRYIGTSKQNKSAAESDVRTRLKLLFPIGLRGEGRDYYTLKTPRFGIRFSAESSIMSSSRQDWSFTF